MQAPSAIPLLPPAPHVKMRDGRECTYDPAELIAAFRKNQGPLAIDFEHAQDKQARKGDLAPAAGWINGLVIRNNALWAEIEWTETAAAMIAAREYRFISPSMRWDRKRIVSLNGAALVNRPALKLPPLDETAANEALPVDIAANELASAAQVYRAKQAALGHNISSYEAVLAVSGEMQAFPHP